ncbi:hypothetical protein GF352_04105 [archaeon]|nr:hypothetical protein [archaeon]
MIVSSEEKAYTNTSWDELMNNPSLISDYVGFWVNGTGYIKEKGDAPDNYVVLSDFPAVLYFENEVISNHHISFSCYISGFNGTAHLTRCRETQGLVLTRIGVPGSTCRDMCGDGVCQEVVCMAIGCPCAETPSNCPSDCG